LRVAHAATWSCAVLTIHNVTRLPALADRPIGVMRR
jgi:hypothetical protein